MSQTRCPIEGDYMSFLFNTHSPWEEANCELSTKIRADKRGWVVVGNRQFPGAMATADWYNRLHRRRKRRGGFNRMRGRQSVWMNDRETAVIVACLLPFLELITGSFLSSSAIQKNLDSINLYMTPGYLSDSTLSVISSFSHTQR